MSWPLFVCWKRVPVSDHEVIIWLKISLSTVQLFSFKLIVSGFLSCYRVWPQVGFPWTWANLSPMILAFICSLICGKDINWLLSKYRVDRVKGVNEEPLDHRVHRYAWQSFDNRIFLTNILKRINQWAAFLRTCWGKTVGTKTLEICHTFPRLITATFAVPIRKSVGVLCSM